VADERFNGLKNFFSLVPIPLPRGGAEWATVESSPEFFEMLSLYTGEVDFARPFERVNGCMCIAGGTTSWIASILFCAADDVVTMGSKGCVAVESFGLESSSAPAQISENPRKTLSS
jgi:hypothetical protein